MAKIQLANLNTSDKNLQLIQDNIQKVVNAVQASPFQGGNLLKNQAITTSGTSIAHGLGRTPTVWTLTDIQGSATIWRTDWDDKFIYLDCSSNVTISVWVN